MFVGIMLRISRYCLLWLSIILIMSIVGLKSEKDYYRAAVLEHVRFFDESLPPSENIQRNIEAYKTAAATAALNGADIIVFPEFGLHPHMKEDRSFLNNFVEDIPDPKKVNSNPCEEKNIFQNRPVLSQLSCMAKENTIYIVANMVDVKKCKTVDTCAADATDDCNSKGCPDDGQYYFNTNVVFNREGVLIAKYYKRHLYFEFDIDHPIYPEDTYFQTDFGNFTTVICFDLLFQESVLAVEKSGVVNLAYPTYWFDHAPFLYFATPNQQAWAFTKRVNLLAANVQNPSTGTLGSGIYSGGRGALIYTHNPDGHSKILISNVPKIVDDDDAINSMPLDAQRFVIEHENAVEIDVEENAYYEKECLTKVLGKAKDIRSDYRCYSSDTNHYNFIKLEGNEGQLETCSNGFCCSLSYKADSMEEDYYLAVSGEPMVFYGTFTFGTEGCFLIRCESHDGHPCNNYVLKSNTIFRTLELEGNFSTNYIFPFAVDSNVRLTDRKSWVFDRKSMIKYRNLNENSLLFFGLYGRRFDLDKISISNYSKQTVNE